MKALLLALLLVPWPSVAQTCEHDASEHARLELVQFMGAENMDPNVIAAMIGHFQKDIVEECQLTVDFDERVRDVFQQFGYFKVTVNDQIVLRELKGSPKLKRFSAQVKVEPGDQYRLAQILFAGDKALPDSDLRALAPIKDGEIFNVQKMRDALRNLRDRYVALGYINFTPVPNTEIDENQRLITITFDLDNGAHYKVENLAPQK
jgi:outer membrane protein assembly factor BamA